MKQRTADALEHASNVVVSSASALKKTRDEIRGISDKHEEQLSIQKTRGDSLKAEVTDLTSQMMKIRALLRILRSKQRIAFLKVGTPDTHRRNLLCYLHISCSKMPGFQAHEAEDIGDGCYTIVKG